MQKNAQKGRDCNRVKKNKTKLLCFFNNKDNAAGLFDPGNDFAVSKSDNTVHLTGMSCFTDKAEPATTIKIFKMQPCTLKTFSTIATIINGVTGNVKVYQKWQ